MEIAVYILAAICVALLIIVADLTLRVNGVLYIDDDDEDVRRCKLEFMEDSDDWVSRKFLVIKVKTIREKK